MIFKKREAGRKLIKRIIRKTEQPQRKETK
jgi:hypothetical protein